MKNNANFYVEKLYGEQLTEDEITELVSSEIKRHKTFIEQKLEEAKAKKDGEYLSDLSDDSEVIR